MVDVDQDMIYVICFRGVMGFNVVSLTCVTLGGDFEHDYVGI